LIAAYIYEAKQQRLEMLKERKRRQLEEEERERKLAA
jgi:hypothetical protein